MLVQYNDKVGIAIQAWRADDTKNYYILVPYVGIQGKHYVEVECLPSEELTVLAPALSSWESWADEREGYTEVKQLEGQLYRVWDDGVSEHPRDSVDIYQTFKEIIRTYVDSANKFLDKLSQKEYDDRVAEARVKGWEVSSIEKEEQTFPYKA